MRVRSPQAARLAQRLISLPFLVLGAWCLLLPGMVEKLSLQPPHVSGTLAAHLLWGCFGAQALLSGLFALFSVFTRATFIVYGIALLPFFWFNYYFTLVEPVFTPLMLLDFGANLAMLLLCVIGWRATRPA